MNLGVHGNVFKDFDLGKYFHYESLDQKHTLNLFHTFM